MQKFKIFCRICLVKEFIPRNSLLLTTGATLSRNPTYAHRTIPAAIIWIMAMKINENTSNNLEYRTKDLGEASALLASGISLLRLERESSYFYFIFENKDTKIISDKYWFGELLINARHYNDAIRSLKDRLFARG